MHGLEKEYGVDSEILDATTPENRQKIQTEYGFKTHGLVIVDESGEIRRKLDGHLLKEEEIRSALESVLSESEAGDREPSTGS